MEPNSPFVIWLTVVTSSNRALKCTNPANSFLRLKSRKPLRRCDSYVLTLEGTECKVLWSYFNKRVPLRPASQRPASQKERRRRALFLSELHFPKGHALRRIKREVDGAREPHFPAVSFPLSVRETEHFQKGGKINIISAVININITLNSLFVKDVTFSQLMEVFIVFIWIFRKLYCFNFIL